MDEGVGLISRLSFFGSRLGCVRLRMERHVGEGMGCVGNGITVGPSIMQLVCPQE